MKNKNHESMLAYFHNQKNGDFNPDTGEIYNSNNNKFAKFMEEERREKEVGVIDVLEKHIINTIEIINNLSVEDGFTENKTQIILLEQKKKIAKNLIMDIFNKIDQYINTIRNLDELKLHKEEILEKYGQEHYAKELSNLDYNRTVKHEALMDSINIANRFAYNNFNKNNDEKTEEWEENELENNREIVHIKRVNLPDNIICPNKVIMSRRENITDWAIQLSEKLGKLKKNL